MSIHGIALMVCCIHCLFLSLEADRSACGVVRASSPFTTLWKQKGALSFIFVNVHYAFHPHCVAVAAVKMPVNTDSERQEGLSHWVSSVS